MPRKPTASPPARGKTSSSRNTPGRAPTRRTGLSAKAASPPASDASAATIFQAPLSLATTVWSQFAEQVQRASEQTWQGLRHDAEVEAEQVQRADTPQQLAGAPIGFAAEQATRWAQLSAQVTASLLDVQAAWFKEVESIASQWMSPLFARDGHIALGSAQDIVEPPGPNGPLQMLWSAHKIWSESGKVWLQAMSHDLQSEAPRAAGHST
ncbi:MAG TPA: hypothetical protein VIY30_08635 [Burkholderiaceae bacterium]